MISSLHYIHVPCDLKHSCLLVNSGITQVQEDDYSSDAWSAEDDKSRAKYLFHLLCVVLK